MTGSAVARNRKELPDSAERAVRSAYELSSRLMDSLIHDVRNPLNALAINVEVVGEKLKGLTAEVSEPLQKNLKSMREQVIRADSVLRKFAEFIAAPFLRSGELELSETVERASEVLSYESRKRRVHLETSFQRGVRLQLSDANAFRLGILQLLFCAIEQVPPGGKVELQTAGTPASATVRVSWAGAEGTAASSESVQGLHAMCEQHGFRLSVENGSAELSVNVS